MTELVFLGRCPTCNQPRVEAATCANCPHGVFLHALGKSGRTECNSYGCECKRYEERP